ncbi:MAG: DUF721 domain-containing protein [Bdellovibrionota bacterium]|nr:hypothetical protein [Pseudobdellovibrionaceae bacterium]|tara:strand:+ start:146276 stop:146650 length:375 start_codon:yes stop_codon:yes gene_type:complete
MKKKDRSKGFNQASDLIHNLFKKDNTALSQQFLRWKLWHHWREVVGENIGKNTDPVGYYRRTLYVWVKSSTWLQEMTFMEKVLVQKVNNYLGKEWVSRIRFTMDRKSVPEQATASQEMKDFISK